MDDKRRERLEQALRDNLKRRKAQSRAQQDAPLAAAPEKAVPDSTAD